MLKLVKKTSNFDGTEADFSTIYRNVNQLLEEKAIRKLVVGNKSIEYESAFDSHDHFICNDWKVPQN